MIVKRHKIDTMCGWQENEYVSNESCALYNKSADTLKQIVFIHEQLGFWFLSCRMYDSQILLHLKRLKLVLNSILTLMNEKIKQSSISKW